MGKNMGTDSTKLSKRFCATAGDCLIYSTGEQGFVLSSGIFTTINAPGTGFTNLLDINNKGVIVGRTTTARAVRRCTLSLLLLSESYTQPEGEQGNHRRAI